ncbi:MAG: OsmC family protein [Spirochaetales bacterium]|nr:OsmC family protein [Leptospiraceae bacterium]MCP5483264.1 OsmC family protein [Spirochaetales bacterium]
MSRTILYWKNERADRGVDLPREHAVRFPGKEHYRLNVADLVTSKDLPTPQDLLLAAFSSSHMLDFLELCAQNDLPVREYRDDAELLLNGDRRPGLKRVTLRPVITFGTADSEVLRGRVLRLLHECLERSWLAAALSVPVQLDPRLEFRPD